MQHAAARVKDDFRHVLRIRTGADHARVDAALSTLDVADAMDLARFLSLHRTCFGAMRTLTREGGPTHSILTDICNRIDDDLETLNAAPVGLAAVESGSVDPLALDYLLEGSRLGTKVLRTRWAQSDDPIVRAADRYFSTPAPVTRWRAVCTALSEIAPDSPRAARIVEDTRRLFALFDDAREVRTDPALRQAVQA